MAAIFDDDDGKLIIGDRVMIKLGDKTLSYNASLKGRELTVIGVHPDGNLSLGEINPILNKDVWGARRLRKVTINRSTSTAKKEIEVNEIIGTWRKKLLKYKPNDFDKRVTIPIKEILQITLFFDELDAVRKEMDQRSKT